MRTGTDVLAHTRTGAGEPVVLVHGITHRRQGWRTVAPLLDDTFEVLAVDLPDHGDSGGLPPGYDGTVGPLADALEEFFHAAGLERPHVVGNSLGGLLALELAARDAVRTATALSPAGFWSRAERVWARTLLGSASATLRRISDQRRVRILSSATGRAVLLGAIMAHPERHDPADLADDLRGLARPTASFPTMLGALGRWDLPKPATVPTVVGWGTKDHLLLPRQHRRLQKALPAAEVYSLPGCGHVPMADDPQAVADLIRYSAART